MEVLLNASETNPNSRLQLTTSTKGVIWFDQVSAMPLETYKVFVSICLYGSTKSWKCRIAMFLGFCFEFSQ